MDDRGLVARARAGDLAAAGELLTRHQRLAYTAALRLVGAPADAEDVAQEALVRAFTHLAELQEAEDFAPWLRRIAVNLSLNVLRRRGRIRFESLDAPPPAAGGGDRGRPEPADESQRTPEAAALGAAEWAEWEGLLRRLPDEQRVAVVLRDVYGYDLAEVAALQRCGLSAAKMRVSRGRAALRQLLRESGPAAETAPRPASGAGPDSAAGPGDISGEGAAV
jgi:RNA polymerase sigma-70 factor (ECF subfamily)